MRPRLVSSHAFAPRLTGLWKSPLTVSSSRWLMKGDQSALHNIAQSGYPQMHM